MPFKTTPAASLRSRFPVPPGEKAPPDLKRVKPPVSTERGVFSSEDVLELHEGEVARIETAMELRANTDEAKLNKLEKAWLCVLRERGHPFIGIQDIALKLAFDCRFNPDFWIFDNGHIILYDVKGFQREDAFLKIKFAARRYTMFRFVIVKRDKQGVWSEEEVKP